MIGFTAQRLMELEVEGQTGAAHGERNPPISTSAMVIGTGYRKHTPGTVELRIPQLDGSINEVFSVGRMSAETSLLI